MKRHLDAVLTVIARGYDVTIEINGSDVGITGQKSESVKLFGKESPMKPVLPPDMQNQICLQEGNNAIVVTYKRTRDVSPPELTIEMQAREQFVNGATFYSRKESIDVGGEKTFSDRFTL